MQRKACFIGMPTYDGRLEAAAGQGLCQYPGGSVDVIPLPMRGQTSPTCNALWFQALSMYRQDRNIAWFAMLHADVAPEPGWLDKLIAEAEQHKADIVSTVIPLKDFTGKTSTAIASDNWKMEPVGGLGAKYPGIFGRLTLQQVHHPSFPRTFDLNAAADALAALPEPLRVEIPRIALLCNTGCMLVRLAAKVDWKAAHFTLIEGRFDDGEAYRSWYLPDDWLFTYRAAMAGAKVMATTAVKCSHIGTWRWDNDQAMGSTGRDVTLREP